tara:strand:+ start:227 stop:649 length:423 start_codon:yes stop_codon:yes gene_type:complete
MANGKLKGRQGGSKSKGPSSGKTSKRGEASSRGASQSSVKSGKPDGISKRYRRTMPLADPKNKRTKTTFPTTSKSESRNSVAFGTKRGATKSRPKSKTTPEVQAGLASIPFRNRDIAKITKTNTGRGRTVSRPMKTNRTF